MPAVLTTAGAALLASRFAQTQTVPIDSVRVGSLAPAQRYDATPSPSGVRTLGLLDATPQVLPTANITLLASMGQVQIDVSDERLAAVYDADELVFMSGTTPIFLVAQQSGPYYRKVANASALFSLNFLIAGNTATNITLSIPTFVFATQSQAEAGTAANVMMSPLRTAQAIDEFAPTVDYQVFTASGTWTKPAGVKADSVVKVQMWGSGGGGETGSGRDGAGGGGYAEFVFPASELGGTEAVVVGAGVSGSTNNIAVRGNDSSFHGLLARGAGRLADGTEVSPDYGGGYLSANHSWGRSVYSGGHEAGMRDAVYGGGAGGGRGQAGGVSQVGGNGGAGNSSGAGGNGVAPGGGGGYGSARGGNGARGEVRVTTFF